MIYPSSSPYPTTPFDRLRLTAARRGQIPPSSQGAWPRARRLVSLALAFIAILGLWNSFRVIPSNKTGNTSSIGGVATENYHINVTTRQEQNQEQEQQAACQKRLDSLEKLFNEKRKIRQEATPTYKYRNSKMLFDLYEPEAVCISEERFGSESGVRYGAWGDGPKFVCGVEVLAKMTNNCLVYSVGSNNDIRFERAVNTYINGCEIHTFDPTMIDTPFVGGKYATFHPWGLGTDGGKEGETMHDRKDVGERMSFETVMKKLGHTNRTIDILKIDCQGCEYAAMPPLFELIASGGAKVNQVLIELHQGQTNFTAHLNQFFQAADKAKLRIFHKERNQWGCDGFRCVEYALVSESFLREANKAVMCSS